MISRDDAHKLTQETIFRQFDITPDLVKISEKIHGAAWAGKFSTSVDIYDFPGMSIEDNMSKTEQIIKAIRADGYTISIKPHPSTTAGKSWGSSPKYGDGMLPKRTSKPTTLIIDWS